MHTSYMFSHFISNSIIVQHHISMRMEYVHGILYKILIGLLTNLLSLMMDMQIMRIKSNLFFGEHMPILVQSYPIHQLFLVGK